MKFTSAGFEIDLLGKTITIPASLWRFVLVGGLGTVVNMIIYYLLSTYLSLPLILCSILAFAVAVTENYLINQTWSFRQESDTKRSTKSYLQYVLVSLPSLAFNLAVLYGYLMIFGAKYSIIGQFIGILIGFLITYLGSKFWIFTRKKMGAKKPISEEEVDVSNTDVSIQ